MSGPAESHSSHTFAFNSEQQSSLPAALVTPAHSAAPLKDAARSQRLLYLFCRCEPLQDPNNNFSQKYVRDYNSSRRDGTNSSLREVAYQLQPGVGDQHLVLLILREEKRREEERRQSNTAVDTSAESARVRGNKNKNGSHVNAACLVNTRRDYDWEQRWTRAAADDREATPDEWQWRTTPPPFALPRLCQRCKGRVFTWLTAVELVKWWGGDRRKRMWTRLNWTTKKKKNSEAKKKIAKRPNRERRFLEWS